MQLKTIHPVTGTIMLLTVMFSASRNLYKRPRSMGKKMEEDTEDTEDMEDTEDTEEMEEAEEVEEMEKDADGHMAKELVDAWRIRMYCLI